MSLGNVLLATSLHSAHSLVVDFTSALAEVNESRLTLLHVLNTKGMDEGKRERARLAARQNLSTLIPSQAGYTHQPVLLVREGDPATVILHEVGSSSQDVLVLGSSGPSMAPRLNNSILRRVCAESQCPVITVRSRVAICAEDTHAIATLESGSAQSRVLGDTSILEL
jgi:nucleotide-binding universal stress UspA family protein